MDNSKKVRWLAHVLLLSGGLLLTIVGIAKVYWGSLDSAKAYARGEYLTFTDISLVANDDSPQYKLTVRNNTLSPIQIMGSRCSCSCLRVKPLPLVVEPGKPKELEITLDPQQVSDSTETKWLREVRFFVSNADVREMSILCRFSLTEPEQTVILEQKVIR